METSRRHRSLVGNNRALEINEDDVVATEAEEEEEEEFDDVEVWDTLSNGFKRAQLLLDQNRDLIQRVNENLMSRIPDNVARNVALINEINGNILRVMEIYSELSVSFAKNFHQRRRTAKNGGTITTTTGSYGGRRRSSCSS